MHGIQSSARTRNLSRLCAAGLAAGAAFALLASIAQPAAAASGGTTATTRVVVNVPGHGSVLAAVGGPKSASTPAKVVTPNLDNNVNLNPYGSRNITPPGGSNAAIQAYGHSYVQVPFFETSANYTNDTSTVQWLGGTPFNATSVTHTDYWTNDGIAISVSVSWPPGIGFSGSGSSASWATTVNNTWRTTHDWDSVYFSAFDIYRVHFNVTGSFQFGSSFYGITGSSSSLV
jgi:hypothetical protein